MRVELTDGCVRVSPNFRKLPASVNKQTGQVYPARVLDRWTKPCIVDGKSGEVISRTEYRNRARRHNAFCDSFGEYRHAVRQLWKNRGVDYPKPEKRGSVRKFSTGSLRRLKVASWQVNFDYMITLTYPDCPDWKKTKDDLNRYLTWLRSIGVDRYLWVAERQKRGSIHFHIIISNGKHADILRRRVSFSNGDRQYCRPLACVGWGRCADIPMRFWCSVGRFERIRSAKNARNYLGKYLSKSYCNETGTALSADGSVVKSDALGRYWGSHRFVRRVSESSALVRAVFKIKGWQVKDTIVGTEADAITTDLIRKLFNQFEAVT